MGRYRSQVLCFSPHRFSLLFLLFLAISCCCLLFLLLLFLLFLLLFLLFLLLLLLLSKLLLLLLLLLLFAVTSFKSRLTTCLFLTLGQVNRRKGRYAKKMQTVKSAGSQSVRSGLLESSSHSILLLPCLPLVTANAWVHDRMAAAAAAHPDCWQLVAAAATHDGMALVVLAEAHDGMASATEQYTMERRHTMEWQHTMELQAVVATAHDTMAQQCSNGNGDTSSNGKWMQWWHQ